jgi:hypothetical protein
MTSQYEAVNVDGNDDQDESFNQPGANTTAGGYKRRSRRESDDQSSDQQGGLSTTDVTCPCVKDLRALNGDDRRYNPLDERYYNQITVSGRIDPTKGGAEAIKFHLSLGFFSLYFVVNIPADNERYAPVFVKFNLGGYHPRDNHG